MIVDVLEQQVAQLSHGVAWDILHLASCPHCRRARVPLWRSAMGVVLYGVAALVALLNPLVSIALSIVISLLYILPSTWGISPHSQSPKVQRPHGGVGE